MGMKGRWFRTRPSDGEMREELEAHVAMRAEHDGVDPAVARRRLGNMLQTREAMRRVWKCKGFEGLRCSTPGRHGSRRGVRPGQRAQPLPHRTIFCRSARRNACRSK